MPVKRKGNHILKRLIIMNLDFRFMIFAFFFFFFYLDLCDLNVVFINACDLIGQDNSFNF